MENNLTRLYFLQFLFSLSRENCFEAMRLSFGDTRGGMESRSFTIYLKKCNTQGEIGKCRIAPCDIYPG